MLSVGPAGQVVLRPSLGVGGLRFKSRSGQIEHSSANGSPSLEHFFEELC